MAHGRSARAVAGVFVLIAVAGCTAKESSAPSPPPSPPVTLVVTYEGSALPGSLAKFTSPAAVAKAARSDQCQFYGLNTANQGGGVDVEVHLRIPLAAIPNRLQAIWALPGVRGIHELGSDAFDMAPNGPGAVVGPYGCGAG